MFKLILHAKVKAWVYRQLWQSFYQPWPYQSFRKLNSTLDYYCTLPFWKVMKEAALDPRSIIKTWFPSTYTDRYGIWGCWSKEKFFTKKVWEDSALLNILFWGHLKTLICVFPIYFKSQRSNFSMRDENKTFKVLHVRFGPQYNAPWSPLCF